MLTLSLPTSSPELATEDAATPSAPELLRRIRLAQSRWATTPLAQRLSTLRRVRHALAAHGLEIASALAGPTRTPAESLVAEVIPLADAIRFLERYAARVLRPVRWGRAGRPAWLARTSLEVRREPLGVVLVIAPENYPLFLPGVQAVQALAAGNAVIVKPAPGRSAAMHRLQTLASDAGLPANLLTITGEAPAVIAPLLDNRVDKAVLTGSIETGRRVLADLAPHAIPATMELSGCDAVFVQDSADLDLLARGLAFALGFNGGRTCVAPRRVFIRRMLVPALVERLGPLVEGLSPVTPEPRLLRTAAGLIDDALARGARRVAGGIEGPRFRPTVLTGVTAEMPVAAADLFVPVLSVLATDGDAHALALNDRCPFALGAAVFGEDESARDLARRIPAGVVVVNDLVVPHADPRLPFGGHRASGFGTTRGAEGLLDMTRPRAITVRGGRFRPHFDPPRAGDESIFSSYLLAAHGRSLVQRLAAAGRLIRALVRRGAAPAAGRPSPLEQEPHA